MSTNRKQLAGVRAGGRQPLWQILTACAVAGVTALLIYWPVLSARALNADDHDYVINNPLVANPSLASAGRFFGEVLEPSTVRGYYHPLSMVSLMLDCAWGASPQNLMPYRRSSLLLHAVNSVLMVIVVYLLLGRIWPAAMAGLVFGAHPQAVESIAWIAERKNLLAALFGLGSIICYVLYTRRPNGLRFGASLFLFGLSLLSKPTTTLMPVLLLLLSAWPLKRPGWRAFWDVIPFAVLAAGAAAITFVSQGRVAGGITEQRSVTATAWVLCHNVAFYLHKVIWPADLASHYAYPDPLGPTHGMVLAGLIGTPLLVAALIVSLRRTRALTVGVLFFYVAIFPALGVIGFTDVIAADRFTYFPMLGLMLILAWLTGKLWETRPGGRRMMATRCGIVAGLLLVTGAEAVAAREYLVHWRDTGSLYRHMIAHAPNVADLRWTLCNHYLAENRPADALPECERAVKLAPDAVEAHTNLGNTLAAVGRFEEAGRHFEKALALDSESATIQNDYGAMLAQQQRYAEAAEHLREAVRLTPGMASAHRNLGLVFLARRNPEQAAESFRTALRLAPASVRLRLDLARALRESGATDGALVVLREAVRLQPNSIDTRVALGAELARQRLNNEAVAEFRAALRIEPEHAFANAMLRALAPPPDGP